MDQTTTRSADGEHVIPSDATVSRRTFFNRARLTLIGVAGVAVFGIATTTSGVNADEDSEKEKSKEKKQEPRDKDRDAKEKEQESTGKEKKSKKSSGKSKDNGSNTTKKKTKKSKNGVTSNKKKQAPVSPYATYIEKKKDTYSCTAFQNQFDAQQVLRLEPKDPNNLDGNHNGVACDGQDAFMDGVAGGLMQPPFDLNPVPRP